MAPEPQDVTHPWLKQPRMVDLVIPAAAATFNSKTQTAHITVPAHSISENLIESLRSELGTKLAAKTAAYICMESILDMIRTENT